MVVVDGYIYLVAAISSSSNVLHNYFAKSVLNLIASQNKNAIFSLCYVSSPLPMGYWPVLPVSSSK